MMAPLGCQGASHWGPDHCHGSCPGAGLGPGQRFWSTSQGGSC